MEKEVLFEIAKIIDSDYAGKEKTFQANRHRSCWHLSSGVCDMSGLIKIWERNNKISSIEYVGPDDEGWRPITNPSWVRVEKYLASLNEKDRPELLTAADYQAFITKPANQG